MARQLRRWKVHHRSFWGHAKIPHQYSSPHRTGITMESKKAIRPLIILVITFAMLSLPTEASNWMHKSSDPLTPVWRRQIDLDDLNHLSMASTAHQNAKFTHQSREGRVRVDHGMPQIETSFTLYVQALSQASSNTCTDPCVCLFSRLSTSSNLVEGKNESEFETSISFRTLNSLYVKI